MGDLPPAHVSFAAVLFEVGVRLPRLQYGDGGCLSDNHMRFGRDGEDEDSYLYYCLYLLISC